MKGVNKGRLKKIVNDSMEIPEDNANVIMNVVSSHIDAITNIYASMTNPENNLDR